MDVRISTDSVLQYFKACAALQTFAEHANHGPETRAYIT
jgi:hypothetical protein